MTRVINPFIFQSSLPGFGDEIMILRGPTGTTDQTDNGNDGSYVGGMGTVSDSGRGGTTAYELDGANDAIAFSAFAEFERTDPFSAGAFIKLDTTSGNRMIIGNTLSSGTFRGWKLRHVNSGIVEMSLRNTLSTNEINVPNATALSINVWYLVVATYDGSSAASGVKIYIDGVDDTGTPSADSLSATIKPSNAVYAGARNGATAWFDGRLDDIRVGDREWSAAEVSAWSSGGRGHDT